MALGKSITTFTVDDCKSGVNYAFDITSLTADQTPNSMDVEFVQGGWRKRFGREALNSTVGAGAVGHSAVDFGVVSGTHKQVIHFGTNVYAMDDMDGTLTSIRASAPNERSFNAKVKAYVIQSYDDNSAPYYWDGSAAAMAVVSASAPGFKRAIEFQGYLMAMNTSANPMRVYYEDINTMIGGTFANYFTLTPAPNDDEISDPFLLNGRLYVGSKYAIFRVSYVGGITVFEYKQVISDVGIVPGTLQVVITKEYGQAALFLGTDQRVYLFDGANIKSISDLYYDHNDYTEISLDLIDPVYKTNSFAVVDTRLRVYRLFITKYGETTNRFSFNVDLDTFAAYPFQNMTLSDGAMCYDAQGRQQLVCLGYDGIAYKMFSETNTDAGTAIDDYWESPIVTSKDSTIKQGQTLTLHLKPVSQDNLTVYDKCDYANGWQKRCDIRLCSSRDRLLGTSLVLATGTLGSYVDVIRAAVNVPVACNSYRFKISSNSATSRRWELLKVEYDQTAVAIGKAEAIR
jgi:hypothetical protein